MSSPTIFRTDTGSIFRVLGDNPLSPAWRLSDGAWVPTEEIRAGLEMELDTEPLSDSEIARLRLPD
jgi:hypothetical protein